MNIMIILSSLIIIVTIILLIKNMTPKNTNNPAEHKMKSMWKNTPIEKNRNNYLKIIDIQNKNNNMITALCYVLKKEGSLYTIMDHTGYIKTKIIDTNEIDLPLEGRFALFKIIKKEDKYYTSILSIYKECKKVDYDFDGNLEMLKMSRMIGL